MKRSPHHFVALAALLSPLLLTALSGCGKDAWPDRDPTVIEDVDADTLRFWPPMKYALPDDFLVAEVRGLKTVYECARLLEFTPVAADSSGARWISFSASVEIPGAPNCPLVTGRDTLVEATAPAAGQRVYLRTPAGAVTDSLRVIAGTGVVEDFLHITGGTDTLRAFNRWAFRDSTAGHPRRVLYTDSLTTCEVVQAAVFERRGGDTLSIRFRTLLDTSPPSCTGVYPDTVVVVRDRYGFP